MNVAPSSAVVRLEVKEPEVTVGVLKSKENPRVSPAASFTVTAQLMSSLTRTLVEPLEAPEQIRIELAVGFPKTLKIMGLPINRVPELVDRETGKMD